MVSGGHRGRDRAGRSRDLTVYRMAGSVVNWPIQEREGLQTKCYALQGAVDADQPEIVGKSDHTALDQKICLQVHPTQN